MYILMYRQYRRAIGLVQACLGCRASVETLGVEPVGGLGRGHELGGRVADGQYLCRRDPVGHGGARRGMGVLVEAHVAGEDAVEVASALRGELAGAAADVDGQLAGGSAIGQPVRERGRIGRSKSPLGEVPVGQDTVPTARLIARPGRG